MSILRATSTFVRDSSDKSHNTCSTISPPKSSYFSSAKRSANAANALVTTRCDDCKEIAHATLTNNHVRLCPTCWANANLNTKEQVP